MFTTKAKSRVKLILVIFYLVVLLFSGLARIFTEDPKVEFCSSTVLVTCSVLLLVALIHNDYKSYKDID